jgi:hypothetical protein
VEVLVLEATRDQNENLRLLLSEWDRAGTAFRTIRRLTDFSRNEEMDYRQSFMDETDELVTKRPKFACRIFSRAVDLTTRSYRRAVNRSEPSSWQDWDRLLWRHANTRVALEEADRGALLGGQSLIVIRAKESPSKVLERFHLFSLPADKWVGLCSPDDPSELGAALVAWDTVSAYDHRKQRVTVTRYLYLDDQCTALVRGRQFESMTTHSLGIVPAVACPNTLSTMRVGGDPIGGHDLFETLRTVNMTFEHIIFAGLLSKGKLAIFGDAGKVSGMGPLTPLELDTDSRAESLPQNANLDGMLRIFQTGVNLLTASWSLPANFFNVVSIAPPQSAAVLQVSTAELEKTLKDRQTAVLSLWEQRLHSRCATMADQYGVRLDPNVDVTYPAVPMVLTPSEQLAEIGFSLENHLMGRENAAVALRPDTPIRLVMGAVKRGQEERAEEERQAALVAGRDASEVADE